MHRLIVRSSIKIRKITSWFYICGYFVSCCFWEKDCDILLTILSYPLFFFLEPTDQHHHEPTHAVYRLVVSSFILLLVHRTFSLSPSLSFFFAPDIYYTTQE